MTLAEQSMCYAIFATSVYVAASYNQRLRSLAAFLASGSACALVAWQLLA